MTRKRSGRFAYGRRLRLFLGIAIALALGVGWRREARELTILHVSDLHARVSPNGDGLGGFARVAGVVAREARASSASLTLHAGDLVHGSPVSSIHRGVPIHEVASHLGIDVACLGDHEFDYRVGDVRRSSAQEPPE